MTYTNHLDLGYLRNALCHLYIMHIYLNDAPPSVYRLPRVLFTSKNVIGEAKEEVERLKNFPELVHGDQWVEHFWDKDFLPWEDGLEPDRYEEFSFLECNFPMSSCFRIYSKVLLKNQSAFFKNTKTLIKHIYLYIHKHKWLNSLYSKVRLNYSFTYLQSSHIEVHVQVFHERKLLPRLTISPAAWISLILNFLSSFSLASLPPSSFFYPLHIGPFYHFSSSLLTSLIHPPYFDSYWPPLMWPLSFWSHCKYW